MNRRLNAPGVAVVPLILTFRFIVNEFPAPLLGRSRLSQSLSE